MEWQYVDAEGDGGNPGKMKPDKPVGIFIVHVREGFCQVEARLQLVLISELRKLIVVVVP